MKHLKNHPKCLASFRTSKGTCYEYRSGADCWGHILVPNSYQKDIQCSYVNGDRVINSKRHPKWFVDLCQEAEKIRNEQIRIRRLMNGD